MLCLRKLAILAATVTAVYLSVPNALADVVTSHNAHLDPKTAPHLQFSGVTLGRENFFTRSQASQTRQRIDGVGVQAIRDVFIWNGTNTPAEIDLAAACNAAQVSSGLKVLMLNVRPSAKSWPADQASLNAYNQTLAAFDAKVFKGTGTDGLPCLPADAPPEVMWMVGNEPNSHAFCAGDGTSTELSEMHQVCAVREAMLLHSSYAFIQHSEEPAYGRNIPVVGGGLSSHDAPFDYLARYFQARTTLGYKTCDMDYFGYHPYALNATNPYSGFPAVETKLVPALRKAGCPLKIIYTEMGVETVIPAGYSYDGTAPTGVNYVSEPSMPAVYGKFVKIMQGQPDVVGFMNFELDDEQNMNGWQSGFYYYSGFPKPFASALRPLLAGIGGGPTASLSLPVR